MMVDIWWALGSDPHSWGLSGILSLMSCVDRLMISIGAVVHFALSACTYTVELKILRSYYNPAVLIIMTQTPFQLLRHILAPSIIRANPNYTSLM